MGVRYKTSALIEYLEHIGTEDTLKTEEIKRRLLKLEKMEEQERKDKIRWKKLCQNKLY